MDAFYRHGCHLQTLDYALTVAVTVVGRPAPDRAIIDSGRKTMNREVHEPRIISHEGIEIVSLSAEHGTLKLAPSAQDLKIGDRLEVLPGYGDLTTVLHDHFYGFRDGRLEVIWPLEGRGKLQ
jgi:D-serine deaminase-like pyridoxal phosphate-dependent protein